MSYDDRIKQVRKLLDGRNLSTAGRHRDLVGRLLEALEEDDTTDLDDDEWAWIYDTRDDIMVQAEARWRREMFKTFQSIIRGTIISPKDPR